MRWILICPGCFVLKGDCRCSKEQPQAPLLIYVASPYTAATYGGEQANVDRAMDAALALIRKGHVPVVPHLSHYLDHWHAYRTGERLPYTLWMAMDDRLLQTCDALLLIAPSPGALAEWGRAAELGLRRFESLEEVPDSNNE